MPKVYVTDSNITWIIQKLSIRLRCITPLDLVVGCARGAVPSVGLLFLQTNVLQCLLTAMTTFVDVVFLVGGITEEIRHLSYTEFSSLGENLDPTRRLSDGSAHGVVTSMEVSAWKTWSLGGSTRFVVMWWSVASRGGGAWCLRWFHLAWPAGGRR